MTVHEYDSKYMSNFSPSLVHRIMMTPPSTFSSLTMNGQPRSSSLTFVTALTKQGFHGKISHLSNGNIDQSSTGDKPYGTVGTPQQSMENTIAQTMRKAFYDAVLCQITQNKQQINDNGNDSQPCLYAPLLEIIQEIHQKLKLLVPNRKDLHQLLNYHGKELQSRLETFQGVLSLLLNIAEKLSLLESEDRSASTRQWLVLAKGLQNKKELEDADQVDGALTLTIPNRDDDDDGACAYASEETLERQEFKLLCKEFILASATFLHDKIEQTETDIADFQLGHILAPKIHAFGKEYLKRDFETRFDASEDKLLLGMDHDTDKGTNVDVDLVPHSRTWLKEIVQTCTIEKEELLNSEQKRRDTLLQIGWVDNILFRSPRRASSVEPGETIGEHSAPFYMPEMLYLDIMSVKAIRTTTKISVVGSALALIASSIGGTGQAASMLRQDPLEPMLQDCRHKLIRAMGNKTVGSQEIFERGVGDAVIELVIVLNPSLEIDSIKEECIRSRTVATMRGDDPVIQLLDNRMRNIFREMMVLNPSSLQQVPDSIRSGRAMLSTGGNSVQGVYGDAYLKASKEEFVKKGFSFYADELAESTLVGHRIMNLTLHVHGPWVDRMMKDTCTNTE